MPEKKNTATQVLTGSTGKAAIDMTPRAAWVTFAGSCATIACALGGVDTALTGIVVTTASTGAVLAAAAFDGFIRPRL
jgi:hypothetical protein